MTPMSILGNGHFDAVLAEARLGVRPQACARCCDDSIRLMFGPEAINAAKMDIEGRWDEEQIVYGIELDTEACTAALPEAKLLKAGFLLADQGQNRPHPTGGTRSP